MVQKALPVKGDAKVKPPLRLPRLAQEASLGRQALESPRPMALQGLAEAEAELLQTAASSLEAEAAEAVEDVAA